MKAFLSYSLIDKDQFVIPLLAQKLQDQGFFVTNGSYKTGDYVDNHTLNEINTSNLFIGIITNSSNSNQRVYNEWLHAQNRKIPAFLLIENTYSLNPNLEGHPNLIRFNRAMPQIAIHQIQIQVDKSQNKNNSQLDIIPWVIGGAALISLLSLLKE